MRACCCYARKRAFDVYYAMLLPPRVVVNMPRAMFSLLPCSLFYISATPERAFAARDVIVDARFPPPPPTNARLIQCRSPFFPPSLDRQLLTD